MGILDNTQQQYYQSPERYGNYQFITLQELINQFMIAYVGEEKLVNKAREIDVQFHARRGLQELSFDTFKCTKAYEINVPSSLKLPLPHDYVNYVKFSWCDAAGIERVLYPASKTSNPLRPDQFPDGSFRFSTDEEIVVNGDYSSSLINSPWQVSNVQTSQPNTYSGNNTTADDISIVGGALSMTTGQFIFNGASASRCYAVWQEIDVSNFNTLDIKATVTSHAATADHGVGIVKFGLSTQPGVHTTNPYNSGPNAPLHQINVNPSFIPGGEILFNDGLGVAATQELIDVDVSMYNTLYVLISTRTIWTSGPGLGNNNATEATNLIDDVSVRFNGEPDSLTLKDESERWSKYKSHQTIDFAEKYDDGTYDLVMGERFGIDPQYSQINGSYYIDELKGMIHFSSSIAGKNVTIKYISDSLGTDEEMQVHKLAEEAMYRYITHAIMSTKANVPPIIVQRLKKEKFAAIRQAKLRLSNIKLEEITQILRGKSKWIKR
jgi:hypothetical protein